MAHYCDGSEFLVGESGVPCTGGIVSARDLAMWGRWLMAIDKHDTVSLSTTREYHDFLRSVQRLELAHQSLQSWRTRDNEMCIDQGEEEKSQVQPRSLILSQILSFLQHEASDDIIARVFDYLESFSLAKVSSTCVRFRRMGHVNARKRTSEISLDRQLGNVMQLLRAQEQIDGIYQFHQNTGVNTRIPLLLLRRRVHVTNAGDPEYNGIYYCTGCNGNGYLFSKPRFPVQRVQRRRRRSTATSFSSAATSDSLPETPFHESSAGVDDDTALPGQPLRCIISKRFSNEVGFKKLMGYTFLLSILLTHVLESLLSRL